MQEREIDLFRQAQRVAHKGKSILYGNMYQGTLGETTYNVDLHMGSGRDTISISTSSWGIYLTEIKGNQGYEAHVFKGEVPEDLGEILEKLKSIPNEIYPH